MEIEARDLSERIAERKRVNAILDLVGNGAFLDSFGCSEGAEVCA